MNERRRITLDGNEAVASVAHRTNEVIALYPITPASPMGEWCDEWTAHGRLNIWGHVPEVVEMQSEAGAIARGARCLAGGQPDHDLHGVAGPAAHDPQHVQDRRRADQLLHARGRSHRGHPCPVHLLRPLRRDGLPADRLCPALLQLRAGGSRLRLHWPGRHACKAACRSCISSTASAPPTRSPRSRNLATTTCWPCWTSQLIAAHRGRALSPDHPVLRGTAQNPDTFFQAREAGNSFYDALPGIVQQVMDRFARPDRQAVSPASTTSATRRPSGCSS